jgi:hypothetical protein
MARELGQGLPGEQQREAEQDEAQHGPDCSCAPRRPGLADAPW